MHEQYTILYLFNVVFFLTLCQVFNSMKHRDVICWNTMIQAHSRLGQVKEALTLLEQMNTFEMVSDEYTNSIILKVRIETSNLHEGRIIHCQLKVNLLDNHYSILI
jgi:pentatricopeptide repeat protein